jgi:hypothetical protein
MQRLAASALARAAKSTPVAAQLVIAAGAATDTPPSRFIHSLGLPSRLEPKHSRGLNPSAEPFAAADTCDGTVGDELRPTRDTIVAEIDLCPPRHESTVSGTAQPGEVSCTVGIPLESEDVRRQRQAVLLNDDTASIAERAQALVNEVNRSGSVTSQYWVGRDELPASWSSAAAAPAAELDASPKFSSAPSASGAGADTRPRFGST